MVMRPVIIGVAPRKPRKDGNALAPPHQRPLHLRHRAERHGEGELPGGPHARGIGEEHVFLLLHRHIEAGQRPGLAIGRHQPRLVLRRGIDLDGRMDMEFRLLMWIDTWGQSTGNVIRVIMAVVGLLLVIMSFRKRND